MIFSYLFFFLASICNGLMDRSSENKLYSEWWNKSLGFGNDENKWKWRKFQTLNISHRIVQKKKLWYYLWILTPGWEEKFPYSSTLLVWCTDGWHLLQFLMLRFLNLSIVVVLCCCLSGRFDLLHPPSFISLFTNNMWLLMLENLFFLIIIWGIGFSLSYYGTQSKFFKKLFLN